MEYKKNSIGDKILCYLGETTVGLCKIGVNVVFDTHSFLDGTYGDTRPSKDFYATVNQMKRTNYLKERHGKLYITKKGREKIIKKHLKNQHKKENKKWDGKWRSIIFDIPEVSRKDRDFLRRELKSIGLIEVQQSVWVSPYQIEKELNTLLKLWKTDFQGDIRFLLIEKMNDRDLKEKFNIK